MCGSTVPYVTLRHATSTRAPSHWPALNCNAVLFYCATLLCVTLPFITLYNDTSASQCMIPYAMHCLTLTHTTLHRIALQYITSHYSTSQYIAARQRTSDGCAKPCNISQHTTSRYMTDHQHALYQTDVLLRHISIEYNTSMYTASLYMCCHSIRHDMLACTTMHYSTAQSLHHIA